MHALTELYKAHTQTLSARTSSALERSSYDAVLIHSGGLQKKSIFDDQFWPLRPVPHFQHWAHLEWPDCALYLCQGQDPQLLFARDKSFWERQIEPDWSQLSAGLRIVEAKSPEAISKLVDAKKKTAFIGEDRSRANSWGLDAHMNPPELLADLDELRVFKTPYELHCLKEANRIAAKGHQAVAKAFSSGVTSEFALHLVFLQATEQDDHETPYKNIVAVGESAAILHHVHYSKKESEGRSLLLDAGAGFRGYASDITRTYGRDQKDVGSQTFRQLIAEMESMQQALCSSVKVGRPYETLHDEAHQRLADVLRNTGVVKMSADECVASGTTRRFLPHGLGHSLGLQCHDVGCAKIRPRDENAWLRNTRVIEPLQVFTIEPGVYFIDTFMEELRQGPLAKRIDWPLVDALSPFGGIRIEDDVVVAEDGSVQSSINLTRDVL